VVLTAKDLTPEDQECLRGAVQDIMQKGNYKRDDLLREVRDLMRQANAAKASGAKTSGAAKTGAVITSGMTDAAVTIENGDAMNPGAETSDGKV
jgi:hypothetical protein